MGSQVLERIPPETILYNLDQITPSSPIPPSSLWSFRHWRIWDFSPKNQARWNSLGINATIVPIAWHPGLERVPNNQEKDIDVLFYGALNHHREAALNRIAGTGVRLGIYNQVFGRELDTLIARSRLVLNIHYYPTGLLETMRISYLLANGKAVLSERSIRSEIPDIYESAVCWTPYEKLAETCLELVSNSDCLKKLETAGKSSIRSIPIAPFIKQALLT
ncbi:hypothetical protein CBW56_02685 [Denitratisoma oestradiolicum]|nr:hypothetical protein CBW56_02685 [Denitratisoma oestradiolicum]